MQINKLILKNFRNYNSVEVNFNPQNNLLMGENGQGKTNILESIYILALMKSHRQVRDNDLIKHGEESYYIKGDFQNNNHNFSVSMGYHNDKKKLSYNEQECKKLSSAIGNVKIVILSHPDIYLITGAPSVRRKYLDITLSLADNLYFKTLQEYQKILRHRNASIRQISEKKYDKKILTAWNDPLIEKGSLIISLRKKFFNPMNNIAKELFNQMRFNIPDFSLQYHSSIGSLNNNIPIQDLFRKKIEENIDKEIIYKQSLYGPHKDDFYIRNGSIDFKRFASQGQTRAGSIILKLSMAQYIDQESQCKSILLLDDILLDLDDYKKGSFLNLIEGRQNIFTATSTQGLEKILSNSNLFQVENSQVYLR